MKNVLIDLAKEYRLDGNATLQCTAMDHPWDDSAVAWKRPALIVVPGGGYGMVSKREAEPIATQFLGRGYQTFILTYTVGGENGLPYPQQLTELASAVDYVKKHAEDYSVNPDEVFVMGFSAGGHLVGDLCVEYASIAQKTGLELNCKPTAAGLCYPVISKEHGHQGSYVNLLYGYSEEAQEELLKTLNLNEAVTKDTPPAFLWTTATDDAVPADNALRYALALANNNVSYELHVYPEGQHGLATGRLEINADVPALQRVFRWVEDCDAFFKRYIVENL